MHLARWWPSIERAYRGLARRRAASAAVVMLWAFVMAAVGTSAARFPPPAVADESSYLLAAETFALGRVTNPPHPMWRHFETYHVLQQPTYTSKYPPANSLFLAAGWTLTGRPIVGVWLAVALMCGAVFWALGAWIGGNLALGLALALAAWLGATYWATSYWGGAVAALGGALVVGALRRIVDGRSSYGSAAMLGIGLSILANSRPYEGLMFSLPAAVVYLRWLTTGNARQIGKRVRETLVPLAAVLAVTATLMLAYNRSVTGHRLELPYMAYQKAYDPTPFLAWQTPASIAPSRHPVLERFRAFEDSTYRAARTPRGLILTARRVFRDTLDFFIPTSLLFPLLLWPLALRDRWTRVATAGLLATAIAMMLSTYYAEHYAAPAVALLVIVYGQCLRWLSRLRAGTRRVGRQLAIAVPVLWTAMGLINLVHLARRTRAAPPGWADERRAMASRLAADPAGSLAVVRYGTAHQPAREWVYNGADVDRARVVWARDMGDVDNAALLRYFATRHVWLVTVDHDEGPFDLRPYPMR